jgi:hypothetical protein
VRGTAIRSSTVPAPAAPILEDNADDEARPRGSHLRGDDVPAADAAAPTCDR